MAKSKSTPQENLKDLVFSERLMQQADVLKQFQLLDEICRYTLSAFLQYSNFAEIYAARVFAEVAAGTTHGRTVFEKYPEEKAESNFKLYRHGSEVEFLSGSMVLMDILASQRPEADKQREAAFAQLRLARLVYEEMVNEFLRLTEGYCGLAETYTSLHCKFETAEGNDAHWTILRLSKLDDTMRQIESTVSTDRENLYHLILTVREFSRNYVEIRNRVVRPYMRVSYKEARNRATTEEQVLENFQNGTQGLIRAISCYNSNLNINFSSYCRHWVRQAILHHLKEESNLVKLPATTWQAHTSIQKAKNTVPLEKEQEAERMIEKQTGLSKDKIRSVQRAVRSSQMFSLDYPIDEGAATLSQLLGVDHKFTKSDEEIEVEHRMGKLPYDQRHILALFYGLFEMIPRVDIPVEDLRVEKIRQKLTETRQKI